LLEQEIGKVVALKGEKAATLAAQILWTYNDTAITKECKISMADLDKDGKLEIIVPSKSAAAYRYSTPMAALGGDL